MIELKREKDKQESERQKRFSPARSFDKDIDFANLACNFNILHAHKEKIEDADDFN